MPYFRESHYTEKLLVGFTPDQRSALDKVSAQKGRSLAGVVRECCRSDTFKVSQTTRGKESKSEGWRDVEMDRASAGRAYRSGFDGADKKKVASGYTGDPQK